MITLDKRTGSVELLPYFPKGAAELSNLDYADASFLGNGPDGPAFIGIERKTVHDLLSSVDTGRLQGHQLPGLLKSYGFVYLIVEGLWRVNKDGILLIWQNRKGRKPGFEPMQHGKRQYMASTIHNLLNTLAIRCGIFHYRTDNISHTANVIMDLYRWWQKPWESHRGHLGFSNKPHPVRLSPNKPGLKQRVAKELPGIDWVRSKAVAEHFDSVLDMCLAGEEEWRGIDGIGKNIAKRVVGEIRGE